MRRQARLMVVIGGIVVLLTAGGAMWWVKSDRPSSGQSAAQDPATQLREEAAKQRERLARLPADASAWAGLAAIHVQLARVSGDPQDLASAEQAANRSLQLRPTAENEPALTALAAIAAARHDFAKAETWAQQAVAADGFSADAYGVLADALIELGRYEEGFAAIQQMMDLRPDTSSYARASYSFELRGDTARARELMDLAVSVAAGPAELAFALQHQAELAINSGELDAAREPLSRALALFGTYPPVRIAAAKLAIRSNDLQAAQAHLATACPSQPTPACLILQAEVHTAMGRADLAAQQAELIRATAKLSGPDIDTILYEADHGDPTIAVTQAQALYANRPSLAAADALAWALHQAGRDHEAMPYADAALRLGTKDALWLFHRGSIALKLGDAKRAQAELHSAITLNPAFSLTHAVAARNALAQMGGRG